MNLIQGDCHEVLRTLPDRSVDLIACDPPFGVFGRKKRRPDQLRDQPLQWEKVWPELWRVIKPGRGVVLFASQPFTSQLIVSQVEKFRYCWYWESNLPPNPLIKKMPSRVVTEICVFGKTCPLYNPPMELLPKPRREKARPFRARLFDVAANAMRKAKLVVFRRPRNILRVPSVRHGLPFQKPVGLLRYLIKAYSQEGDTVLDFCMGSGSTAVACKMTGREFIGIEKDAATFARSKARIEQVKVWRLAAGLA